MENFNLKEVIEKLNEINTNSALICPAIPEIDISAFLAFSNRIAKIGSEISQNVTKFNFENIKVMVNAFAESIKIQDGYYISTKTGGDIKSNYEPAPIEYIRDNDFYICKN